MNSEKIRTFMTLAGQRVAESPQQGSVEQRILGAQLLLSEVLEYVVHGLGLSPVVGGVTITDPNELHFTENGEKPDFVAMLDGLSDVAYTMFWNACAFGLPLSEAFELVCENNLEKFVHLAHWKGAPRSLSQNEWGCGLSIAWPPEVVQVDVMQVGNSFYAVGKDIKGKVRKPSTYRQVELEHLVKG